MKTTTGSTLAVLVTVSLLTHLLLIGGKSFWVDEAYAVGLMHLSPREVIELSSRSTPHPPGAFLLIRASTALAGRTEGGARLLNALAVASGVIPLFLLLRRFLKKTEPSFWAAMTWAVSPYSVALGQEAWVYGFPAALALWCVYLASIQWKRGYGIPIAWFLICLAGLYSQFSFIFAVVSSIGVMAASGRVPRRAWAGLLLALALWAPLVIQHAPELLARSARLSAGGVGLGTAPHRIVRNAPLAVAGLFADGLVPHAYRDAAHGLWNALALFGPLLLASGAMAALAVEKAMTRKLRAWAFFTAALPFIMFLGDAPGERQLFLAALPLTIGMGALFNRFRSVQLPAMLLLGALLAHWYSLNTNAYHRSDWRSAAAHVNSRIIPGDVVYVTSGQSGGIAWDLSGGTPDRLALGGDENPWSTHRQRSNPEELSDSILTQGHRLWLVADLWGSPPLPPNRVPSETWDFGRDMRVFLFLP
jgi:hypothetical protein